MKQCSLKKCGVRAWQRTKFCVYHHCARKERQQQRARKAGR